MVTVIILTFTTSSAKAEPAQAKNEVIEVPVALKPLEPNSHAPIATSAKVSEPVSGTERVFCGSPKQRNWKNSNASNIAIGTRLAAERGWTGTQMDALKELWSCESSWTTTAGNRESGAYGIPQSLPASKMASHGADYSTNPETQIRWGLDYILSRYKTPRAALDFHYAKNWY